MSDLRAALYLAPEPADPLWQLGNAWLGRDPATGAPCAQPQFPGLAAITAAPRHYGFHATLRPPMRLAAPWPEFRARAAAIAARAAPFPLPQLRVASLDGFLALVADGDSPALHALAELCVRDTDDLRAPPEAAELARRRAAGLSPLQEANLARFGYPYVLAEWRFHITLTRRLEPAEHDAVAPLAERHFALALAIARRVESIAMFTEVAGAPMRLVERLALTGKDVLF